MAESGFKRFERLLKILNYVAVPLEHAKAIIVAFFVCADWTSNEQSFAALGEISQSCNPEYLRSVTAIRAVQSTPCSALYYERHALVEARRGWTSVGLLCGSDSNKALLVDCGRYPIYALR
ncbi:hypothetical protein V5799_021927, partial [Amblyomma americanum]